jgi:hypothetical protein
VTRDRLLVADLWFSMAICYISLRLQDIFLVRLNSEFVRAALDLWWSSLWKVVVEFLDREL